MRCYRSEVHFMDFSVELTCNGENASAPITTSIVDGKAGIRSTILQRHFRYCQGTSHSWGSWVRVCNFKVGIIDLTEVQAGIFEPDNVWYGYSFNCTLEWVHIPQLDTVDVMRSRGDDWKCCPKKKRHTYLSVALFMITRGNYICTSVACAVQLIDVSATITKAKTSFITIATIDSAAAVHTWAALMIASSNTRSTSWSYKNW